MRWTSAFAGLAVAGAVALASAPASANDGAALAGGIAGFVGGVMVGNAMRPHYPPPAYTYVDEDAPPAYCHWVRGRAYWDEYEGVWRHRRIRVCD